jgi:hypothetical protein
VNVILTKEVNLCTVVLTVLIVYVPETQLGLVILLELTMLTLFPNAQTKGYVTEILVNVCVLPVTMVYLVSVQFAPKIVMIVVNVGLKGFSPPRQDVHTTSHGMVISTLAVYAMLAIEVQHVSCMSVEAEKTPRVVTAMRLVVIALVAVSVIIAQVCVIVFMVILVTHVKNRSI